MRVSICVRVHCVFVHMLWYIRNLTILSFPEKEIPNSFLSYERQYEVKSNDNG